MRLTSKSLRKLGLKRFSKLERLSLRQNEIAKISPHDIGALPSLVDIDLYDNALDKTYGDVLKGCPNLEYVVIVRALSMLTLYRSLDFSFNSIRHISHLSHLAKLHTLYLVQNKISRVRPGDLDVPLGSNLKSLELGGNRLRVSIISEQISMFNITIQTLENIDHLSQLEELWVGKNKITKLEVRNYK